MFPSMPRAGPRVLFIDDIILYRDDARQPLCPGFGRLSLVEEARAYENNCIFAEGAPSPRLGPRVDPRPALGPRTLFVSYRSFRSSMRLMSSVYAAANKILRYRVFYLKC